MGRSRRSSVQRYHDRVAHQYDHSYEDAFWLWHDALTWDYIKPFLPRDLSKPVLDLGCGTGKWGAKLHKSGFRVTCVDISPQMLDQARQKLAEQGAVDRADFIQADLCDLSALPTSAFSFALALGEPIGCTESPARAMKEIRRRLLPGAILVATFDNRLAAIDYYLERGQPAELQEFLRTGRTHWLTKDAGEQFPIVTLTPTQLAELGENSGFEVLEIVGKTALPMRHHRQLLADPDQRRVWATIEKRLARDRDALGRAPHLQAALRVRN